MNFIFFVMAYAVKNSATRLSHYTVDIFLLAKIRILARKAIVAVAHLSTRRALFKKGTPPKLGYNKTAVLGVSFNFSLFHTQSASSAINIYAIPILTKKLPELGSLSWIVLFLA